MVPSNLHLNYGGAANDSDSASSVFLYIALEIVCWHQFICCGGAGIACALTLLACTLRRF